MRRFLLVLSYFSHCSASENGYFWQLTDLHVDTAYNATFGDPNKACHVVPHSSSPSRHNLSVFGDFRCDAPLDLIEVSILGMKSLHPNPDFIIWNGDSITHIGASGVPPPFSYVTEVEKKIAGALIQHFPETRIIPVLGNHDSSPPDFFPDIKEDKNSSFYRDYFMGSNWSTLITDPLEQKQFCSCGYYRTNSADKTFLVLNTNLYYQNNNTGVDPCDQLKWLMTQLSQAKPNSVILAAHVPPGYYERTVYGPFMMTQEGDYHYNEFYIDIVTKFSDRIYAQFYGHTHTDSFRLFGYPDNVSSVAFIAPSVTPKVDWVSGTFPSIRLYEYNADKLMDYHQYYYNITNAKPSWERAYAFRDNYGTKDLTVESVRSVFDAISSDINVFNRYYELNTVYHRELPCHQKCIHNHLCGISQLRVQGMKNCLADGQRLFQLLSPTTNSSNPATVSLFRSKLSPVAEFGIYVIIIAPLAGFLLSFAYLIRSRRLRVGRGYRSVPLMEEI